MINEILSCYKGSAEEQAEFMEELEQLDDHQQNVLRVYLEYDDSLLNYKDLWEAVELAEEAFLGRYDCGADFAADLMESIDPDFADKVNKYMGWKAWQLMWENSLGWDYQMVELDGVDYVIHIM